MEKKKKIKLIIILSVIAVLIMAGSAAYTGYVYGKAANWDNLIYPNVTVRDLNIGGKTKEQAKALLKEKFQDSLDQKKINIKYQDKTYTIEYTKLNARYDIDKVLEEAFNYGKDGSIFKKNKLIKNGTGINLDLEFDYDEKHIADVIATMEQDINKEPINGKLEMISSGKFNVIADKKGYKLQSDQLKNTIINNINDQVDAEITINAPVETLTAKITAEELDKVDSLISSFSTSFTTSAAGRINNIELATKAINGLLLMPGDTFSFNEVVGERTKERGYKEAGVIINNRIESGLGGGICQVSSTLYNAILKSNINSTERYPHSLPSSYVDLGRDATVDWGNLDYKFTNTLEYPIYIEGYTKNKVLYFNIYSNKSLTNRRYEIVNHVYETVKATTKTVQDSTMPAGSKKIVQQAQTGYKVKVYRNTYDENNKLIKQELISDDYYKPVQGIVKVGTKKSN
ncbi:MAG: hypothetical protein GX206_05045 [Clostridiales bacterium]|nr:hypothetical protein [Clostridiales bacterium]